MIRSLLTSAPEVQVGKIKILGSFGPSYKVIGAVHSSGKDDWLVPIRVIETGEELEYRYSRSLQDPEAR